MMDITCCIDLLRFRKVYPDCFIEVSLCTTTIYTDIHAAYCELWIPPWFNDYFIKWSVEKVSL